ncbi:MAG: hypothetical protein HOO95_05150 [Gallionella sp.]|nr:hypothetical protein [Gallionella sp.]
MKLKTINFTVGGLFIWAVIGVTSSHSTKPASRWLSRESGNPARKIRIADKSLTLFRCAGLV